MNPGFQIEVRCRVRGPVGEALHSMPRRPRSRVIAATIAAALEEVDLDALLEAREELRRLGVLLNQSLRFSFGEGVGDAALMARVVAVVELVESLVRSGEKEAL